MADVQRGLVPNCLRSVPLGAIRKQLAAFLEGFYEIIPKRLISIFTEQELELLISGLPTIDIDDLKANTEYHKYQSSSIQVLGPVHSTRSGIILRVFGGVKIHSLAKLVTAEPRSRKTTFIIIKF